ncbi:ribosome biogenesis protein tsr1 [Fistulina hepatica ATCC 64428]|uniref:Ribosome biogenesis protein tsr1 n=1 Tax=Fistulina hepatica ATCC 64428 TaxID=1128425 RepID=A0A0D7A3N0_9AGAR|nr:ribosome biogenesis protein tsr1 [Fistulina hepatica ATCC 64428]
MPDATQHHHRPTLKQQNKPFKSRHSTKSALKDAAKVTSSKSATQHRDVRRQAAKQVQAHKRAALVSATRIFSGADGAPRIVAVVPLSDDISQKSVTSALACSVDISSDDCPDSGLWKIRADRFKTSLQFIILPYRDFHGALDACKVADYVVLALSPTAEVDEWGDTLLRTLQAQGLPDVVAVVAPSEEVDAKSRPGILKSLLSFIQYFVPNQKRVFDLHIAADRISAVRALAEGCPEPVRWREGRAWLLGEQCEWVADADGAQTSSGTLAVSGVVRGAPLSANRLIHLPNYGDFQISKILSAASCVRHGDMDVEPQVLAEPDPSSSESLASRNDPDDMANEQTWPTEEEMRGVGVQEDEPPRDADGLPGTHNGMTSHAVRRLPRGMSEYQAAWIVDDDDLLSDDDLVSADGDAGSDAAMDKEGDDAEEDVLMDHDMDVDMDSHRSVVFQDLDKEEEEKQLQSWRNREREEADDLQFPDEMDTPQHIPARERFQRFRGLRSFRTSPWDPYENLPLDYARIFQFEDFKRTERGVQKRAAKDPAVVQPGVRVTVHLHGVPRDAVVAPPFTLFSLLQHEHKTTVLHFTVQRNTEYDGPVRSKDPLVLCVGPRRLRVNPIYSQHTRGGGKGPNNVHRFDRYLRHGVTNVATMYGPVTFGRQSCVLLRETDDVQAPQLVATGTFLNPDTTRIIAKRVILTGHPFKVHKKTATVRYMFFNPEDVQYFKPIQLHTKHGRVGHIRESLGTHGYFKAYFDGPINQMDTVCMSLYKRVYPKWSQLWTTTAGHPAVLPLLESGDEAVMEE